MDFLGVPSTNDTVSPSILSIPHHLTLEQNRHGKTLSHNCHICRDEEGISENGTADQNQSSEVAKENEGNKIISSELSSDTLNNRVEQLDNSVSANLTSASFSAKDREAY